MRLVGLGPLVLILSQEEKCLQISVTNISPQLPKEWANPGGTILSLEPLTNTHRHRHIHPGFTRLPRKSEFSLPARA